MSDRKPDKFKLNPKDKIKLLKLLRNGQTPLRVARRAQILLGRANGQLSVAALSQMIGQAASTLWRVCKRYRQQGLPAAVEDAPRSGRPRVFSPERTQAN